MPLAAHEYFPSIQFSTGPMFENKTWYGPELSASIFFDKNAGSAAMIDSTPELETLQENLKLWNALAAKARTITFDDLVSDEYLNVFTEEDKNAQITQSFLARIKPLADRAKEIVESSKPEAIEAKRAEYLAKVDELRADAEAVWAEANAEIHRLQEDQAKDARKDIILAQKEAVREKADEREAILNPEGYRETRYYTYVDDNNNLVDEEVYLDFSARLAVAAADEEGKLSALQADYQAVENEYDARINEVYQEAYDDIAEIKEDIQTQMNLYEETFKDIDNSERVKEVEDYLSSAIRIAFSGSNTAEAQKRIKEIEGDIDRQNYLASQASVGKIGLSVGTSLYFSNDGSIPFGNFNAGASFKLYDGRMYRLLLNTDALLYYGFSGMFGLGAEVALKNYFIFGNNFGLNLNLALAGGYAWNYPFQDYYGYYTGNTGFVTFDVSLGFVYRFH